MESPLSAGAIAAAYRNGTDAAFAGQVLELSHLTNPQGVTRATLTLSDGVHLCRAVSTPLHAQIQAGAIQKFSVINVSEYIISEVSGRRLMILIKAEPAACPNPGHVIGQPKNIEAEPVQQGAARAQETKTVGRGSSGGYSYASGSRITPDMAVPPQGHWQSGSRSGDGGPFTMISQLNPYMGGRCTLKLRATHASGVRSVPRKRDGERFDVANFEFVDENGGQIKATVFGQLAAQFASSIQTGKVYVISRMEVKTAEERWGPKLSDWELRFTANTQIAPTSDDGAIPQQQFTFTSIEELNGVAPNATVDVVGVVTDIGPVTQITTKKGEPMDKRTIVLRDQSKQIEMTIWGERAKEFAVEYGTVVAFKNVRVGDFGGRSLSFGFSTTFFPSPAHNQCMALVNWWKSLTDGEQKRAAPSQTVRGMAANARRIVISQIDSDGLGYGGLKGDIVEVRAWVQLVKFDITRPCWYAACSKLVADDSGYGAASKRPPRVCNKKLRNDEATADVKRCDRCGKVEEYDYRFMFQLQIGDVSGNAWVTAFDEAGKVILDGIDAREVAKFSDDNEGNNRVERMMRAAAGKQYIVQLRVKAEPKHGDTADGPAAMDSGVLTPDNSRVRCTILHIRPLTDCQNILNESQRLVDALSRFVRL